MAKFKNPRATVAKGGPPAVIPRFEIIEPRCKICTHPQRREIDMMLSLGWSQVDVIRHWNQIMELQDLDEAEMFRRNGMSIHANKHLSMKDAANRKIIEARAIAEGIDIDTIEGFILTKTGVLEQAVLQGLDSMQRGHTIVEPRDLIAAVKTLAELEKDRSAVVEETLLRDFKAFTTAVKRVVPEEQWDEIYVIFEEELGRVNPAIMPASYVEQEIIVEAEEVIDQLQLFDTEEYEDGHR